MPLRFQVLVAFLAQLFQHLLAVVALFQQIEAAVDPAVEADRFAENDQIEAFDQSQNGDENRAIDNWFGGTHVVLLGYGVRRCLAAGHSPTA